MDHYGAIEIIPYTKGGGNQIEYEDEDPEIRKMYEEELAKECLTVDDTKMPPAK